MALYPDISHWHPVTDWAKAKENCPFLISKATQGTSSKDSTLDAFIKGCEENEIPYWLYTFLNKGNEKAQAEYLVSTCSAKVGSHFVGYILDIEAENTAANVQAALDYLSAAGTKTMLYTMYAQYNTYKSVIEGRPSTCAWWEARYGQNTGSYSSAYPCHSGADLHQYTSKGTCGGVSGVCDLNRITGAADKDEAWFKTPLSGTSATTSTAAANTASSTTSSTDTASTGSFVKGQSVKLSSTPLYASATTSKAASKKTGTYYIWDATIKSSRIRITNNAAKAGVTGHVTGWVNVSDIS